MPGHHIIVIGTSAAGVGALQVLVGGLPRDLPATIFIVLHLAPIDTSLQAEILTWAGPLPATQRLDGAAIRAGHIYVAPPDHHLPVEPGHVHRKKIDFAPPSMSSSTNDCHHCYVNYVIIISILTKSCRWSVPPSLVAA